MTLATLVKQMQSERPNLKVWSEINLLAVNLRNHLTTTMPPPLVPLMTVGTVTDFLFKTGPGHLFSPGTGFLLRSSEQTATYDTLNSNQNLNFPASHNYTFIDDPSRVD